MSTLTTHHRLASRLTLAVLLIAVTVLGACKKGPTDPEGRDGPSNSVARVDQ